MTLLSVEGLSVRYGPIIAVRHLTLHVDVGEIVCLVGPNGAGKSSTTLAIAGALRPAAGASFWMVTTSRASPPSAFRHGSFAGSRRPSDLWPDDGAGQSYCGLLARSQPVG